MGLREIRLSKRERWMDGEIGERERMRFLYLIDRFGEIGAWIRVFRRSGCGGLDDSG